MKYQSWLPILCLLGIVKVYLADVAGCGINHPCQNGGTCNSGKCSCPDGLYGVLCQFVDCDGDGGDPCQNGAVCEKDDSGKGGCPCTSQCFSGALCEIVDPNCDTSQSSETSSSESTSCAKKRRKRGIKRKHKHEQNEG